MNSTNKVILDLKQRGTGEKLEYKDKFTIIKEKFNLVHGKGKRKKKKRK